MTLKYFSYKSKIINEKSLMKNFKKRKTGVKLSRKSFLYYDKKYQLLRQIKISQQDFNKNVQILVLNQKNKLFFFDYVLNLIEIFKAQLPNIPRSYIESLVSDQEHEIIIIRGVNSEKRRVLGACCYRIFQDQQIIELAFLSVSRNFQRIGLGSRLLDALKKRSKIFNVNVILTCADNNAVLFFEKQGFSKVIDIPRFFWIDFFRDYEEITFMQCNTLFNQKSSFPHLTGLVNKINWEVINRNNDVKKSSEIRESFGSVSKSERAKENTVGKCLDLHKRSYETARWLELNQELENVIDSLKFLKESRFFLGPIDSKFIMDENFYDHNKKILDLRTLEERVRTQFFYNNPDLLKKDLKNIIFKKKYDDIYFPGIGNIIDSVSEMISLIEKF